MSPPRKVPGIARGPQSFSRSVNAPIQSPMMQPMPNPVQQAMAAPFQTIGNIPAPAEPVYSVDEDIQDLAMEIYSQLAIDHIKGSYPSEPNACSLRSMASYSKTAARIFFEDQSNEQQ